MTENQKLIQSVKLALTERVRQIVVRFKHARQRDERARAQLELLVDDFVQEGHDLRKPEHRELLYQVIAAKATDAVRRSGREESEMEGQLMGGFDEEVDPFTRGDL